MKFKRDIFRYFNPGMFSNASSIISCVIYYICPAISVATRTNGDEFYMSARDKARFTSTDLVNNRVKCSQFALRTAAI